jgi:hypothetical protein
MRNAYRFLIPVLVAAAGFTGSALAATQAREVAGFKGLALSAPVHVDLVIGDQESLVLEGDEKALADLETYVKDGSLHIRRKPGSAEWTLGWPKNGVRARLTAKQIDAIAISGSGDVTTPQLSGDKLAISISGSGDVSVGGGKVSTLSIHIAGSGDVKAAKLDAQAVSVSISGSGDALVWARQSLAVRVAGSGDVRYYGDPALAQSVAGSGSVKRMGATPT